MDRWRSPMEMRLLHGRSMLIPSRWNAVTGTIIECAIEVHRTLGPGLLESIYLGCLCHELTTRHVDHARELLVPVTYKGIALDATYRLDLIVEEAVIVEVKSVAALLPVHQAQVLTYMKLTRCPLGLILNFNVPRLVEGVKRLVLPKTDA